MPRVEFGMSFPESGAYASVENIAKVTKESESLGYDSIWTRDHIIWPTHLHRHHITRGSAESISEGQDPNFFECITTIAYLAGLTRSIKFGISILVLPTRHPVLAAKQTANLDVLSNGRLIVGMGLGWDLTAMAADYDAFNVRKEDRYAMAEEHIQVIKNIWTQRKATFHGKFVRFTDIEVFPKPIQKPHPPIFYGGGGRTKYDFATTMAARYADGWHGPWLTPEEMGQRIQVVRSKARDFGRGDKNFTFYASNFMNIAESRERARSNLTKTIQASLKNYERQMTFEEAMERTLAGTPNDILHRIGEYADVGVTRFMIRPIHKDMDELFRMMKVFQEEIAPSFK